MKKGKLLVKVAIGLATFGLLFTGCNNKDPSAEAPVQGTAVTVTTPVTSKADAEEVMVDVLKEYSEFLNKQIPSSRAVTASTGKDTGDELTRVTKGLLDFIKNYSGDFALLKQGIGPTKDISYSDSIKLEDITPTEMLESIYYYTSGLVKSNITYEEFLKTYELTDAEKALKLVDNFVTLSNLDLAVAANYKAATKEASASVKTNERVYVGNVDTFLATIFEVPADQVPQGLKYVSVKNNTDVSASFTAGTLLKPTNISEAKAFVNEEVEVRINMVNKDGKGGYFTINPIVECKAAASSDGKAYSNVTAITGIKISVSDGTKETCALEYSKEELEAFAKANKDLIEGVSASLTTYAGTVLQSVSGLVSYVTTTIKTVLAALGITF